MVTETKEIEMLLEKLPPDMKNEVANFIEYLINRSKKKQNRRKLKQNWAGALKEFKHQYTSVGLQHKASEWRDT